MAPQQAPAHGRPTAGHHCDQARWPAVEISSPQEPGGPAGVWGARGERLAHAYQRAGGAPGASSCHSFRILQLQAPPLLSAPPHRAASVRAPPEPALKAKSRLPRSLSPALRARGGGIWREAPSCRESCHPGLEEQAELQGTQVALGWPLNPGWTRPGALPVLALSVSWAPGLWLHPVFLWVLPVGDPKREGQASVPHPGARGLAGAAALTPGGGSSRAARPHQLLENSVPLCASAQAGSGYPRLASLEDPRARPPPLPQPRPLTKRAPCSFWFPVHLFPALCLSLSTQEMGPAPPQCPTGVAWGQDQVWVGNQTKAQSATQEPGLRVVNKSQRGRLGLPLPPSRGSPALHAS